MLECVLYQRNEDKRRNKRLTIRLNVELSSHPYIGRQADTHQFNIVADKIHFLAKRYIRLLIIIQYLSEKFAQLLHRLLCLVRVKCNQSIDIIQRIQQEVGIQLVAQVFQFGFRTASFSFFAGSFVLRPSGTHTNGGTQSDGKDKAQHVPEEEQPSRRHTRSFGSGSEGWVECQALPQMK